MPRDRTPNKPIGTVECPAKGCTLTCKVFRFRQRNEKRTRLAGLLYLECPEHGRIGIDGKKATQEYILEHADIPKPITPEAGASADVRPGNRGTEAAPASLPAVVKKPASENRPATSWLDRLKTALD
ncbi:MAG TPA: hypothetical protein VFA39_18965 [Steroidobacteraceae bacterium]|nr:hypothetical protein [Steroidobacteraceae bacterium]